MRRTLIPALLSVVACAAWSSPAHAWFVRAPFVSVGGGPGVSVRAPFVDVRVGGYAPVPVDAPLPGGVVVGRSPAPVVVPPPPPPPVVVRALSVDDFVATFRPAPGTYEVTLLHTRTGCPVTVCFTLPPGCPTVCVHRHQIDFDYGREEVRIRFQIGGKVKVSYH
jgi:hypothetical protein